MRKLILLIAFCGIGTAVGYSQSIHGFTGYITKDDSISAQNNSVVALADMKLTKSTGFGSKIIELERNNPGFAFLSSGILPGSAQAANGKWIRAGIYALTEAATIAYYFNRNATAKRQERDYERYADRNWSVLAYAQWLVDYSQEHHLTNGYEELANHIAGQSPDFSNTRNDWFKVSLPLLQKVERNTPYVLEDRRMSNFSHNLPDYGSQQYYELISKYWQFQSGWQDIFLNPLLNPNFPFFKWDGSDASAMFYEGRDRASDFNDNYRLANNLLSLIIVNHIISAFDGYMTVKLNNSRLQASANLLRPDSFSLVLSF